MCEGKIDKQNKRETPLTLIRWYKNLALVSALLWVGLGVLTVGSIAVSTLGWAINLIMGALFIFIGWYIYARSDSFCRVYSSSASDMQNNPHIQRFLRLDLMFVLGACLVGGSLLVASISRVFGDGFAVFG